jgi:hypothetical protein
MSKLPFNVMRHNDWDRVPRDPVSVGTLILGQSLAATSILTIGTYTLTLGAVVGYLATTAITSLALGALAPKVPKPEGAPNSPTLINSREPAATQEYVYGEVRKGGTIVFMESTDSNFDSGRNEDTYLHVVIALAGHRIEEVGDIYVNDQIVSLDSNGFVTDDRWLIKKFPSGNDRSPSEYVKAIRIRKHDGSQTTADSALVDETSATSSFIGKNIAYIYVRMQYDYSNEVFANGVPTFTAVVKGKRVLDPRTGTTAWSDNAALCIRDYITSEYGLNDPLVDNAYFASAANDSDESVLTAGGGFQKRYTINGVINAASTTGRALQEIVQCVNGDLYFSGGSWKLRVGVYEAAVKTFTLADLRSTISLQTRFSRRESFNRVTGTFIDKDSDWIEQDYPAIESSAFLAEDNNIENTLDASFLFINDGARAQRVAKQMLFRMREQMTFIAEFGLNAIGVEVGDTVRLTITDYGWTNKEFQVSSWQLLITQEGGVRVKMSLRETSSAAYNWNAEEQQIIKNNTNLPTPFGGLTINNLTVAGGGRLQGDGTFINSAILGWDEVQSTYVSYYEIQWKALADSAYNTTRSNDPSLEIMPLVDGVEYIFRVRAVTIAGISGSWASVTFTGGGDTTTPGLPTAISATGGFGYITVRWTNPADLDFNYVEVWENTSNTTVGATQVGISAGDEFVRTNLGISITRWYFLKAVDYSGNKSGFTSGVQGTTTFIDDDDFADGIYSLFTDQGLYAIRDVISLPAAGAFVGEKVYNRTDGKLYQWTGSAWVLVVAQVNAPDINGQLVTNQIATGAITNTLIATNAITETKISSDAITTPKIAAGAVTAGEIATGAVTATKIASNSITSDKIVAGTIQASDIATGTITATQIAGNTITGNKIVANTITGGLLATSGIITTSAQIDDAVIVNAKIGNLQVDRIKIATGAVTTSVTTSVANFVSVSATSTTSPNYSPVRVPSEADFQARPGDFRFVASRSIQIHADDNLAPEQLDVTLSVPREPSWTLLSNASELTNLTHGIFVRARVGSALKLSGSTVYNGSEHFLSQMMYNYYTVGLTNLFGLSKGTEYNAGDLLIFDLYYWRYRSTTRWGIGMTMDGATMNVREFFR